MGTEGDQSSGNRNIPVSREDSREEERQHTGLFRWDDPENLMPSWSVPPGLIIPGPRQPDADARPSERGARPSERGARPSERGARLSEPGARLSEPGPQPSAAEPPADRSSSWPGVAPPAGWFLHSARSLSAGSGKPADDAPAEPER